MHHEIQKIHFQIVIIHKLVQLELIRAIRYDINFAHNDANASELHSH